MVSGYLSREPDTAGFNAWVNVLNGCSDVNNNPACDWFWCRRRSLARRVSVEGISPTVFTNQTLSPTDLHEIVTDEGGNGVTANEVFRRRGRSRTIS